MNPSSSVSQKLRTLVVLQVQTLSHICRNNTVVIQQYDVAAVVGVIGSTAADV